MLVLHSWHILQQTHTVYTTFSSLLCRWTDCRCMKYNLVLVEASSIVGQRGRLQQNRYLKKLKLWHQNAPWSFKSPEYAKPQQVDAIKPAQVPKIIHKRVENFLELNLLNIALIVMAALRQKHPVRSRATFTSESWFYTNLPHSQHRPPSHAHDLGLYLWRVLLVAERSSRTAGTTWLKRCQLGL